MAWNAMKDDWITCSCGPMPKVSSSRRSGDVYRCDKCAIETVVAGGFYERVLLRPIFIDDALRGIEAGKK